MKQISGFLATLAMVVMFTFGANAGEPAFPTGKWVGWWTDVDSPTPVMKATLEVETVTPGDGGAIATGRTDWEAAPKWDQQAGGFAYKKGLVEGVKLTIGKMPGTARYPALVYELRADGTLEGIRFVNNVPTSRITLRRVDNQSAATSKE